jgi:hypothetical protein
VAEGVKIGVKCFGESGLKIILKSCDRVWARGEFARLGGAAWAFFTGRRRNLWVTEHAPMAAQTRLAKPASPMRDNAASAFLGVPRQLPFGPV